MERNRRNARLHQRGRTGFGLQCKVSSWGLRRASECEFVRYTSPSIDHESAKCPVVISARWWANVHDTSLPINVSAVLLNGHLYLCVTFMPHPPRNFKLSSVESHLRRRYVNATEARKSKQRCREFADRIVSCKGISGIAVINRAIDESTYLGTSERLESGIWKREEPSIGKEGTWKITYACIFTLSREISHRGKKLSRIPMWRRIPRRRYHFLLRKPANW